MCTTAKKYIIIIASAIAALFSAAFALCFCCGGARAETIKEVRLASLASGDSSVVYRHLDAPNSVYADSIGILIAGESSVAAVSGETEVTSTRAIPADKVYRHTEHGDHGEFLAALRNGRVSFYCGDAQPTVLSSADGEATDIVDFAVNGDTLYAVTRDGIYIAALTANGAGAAQRSAFVSDRYPAVNAIAVTVLNGKPYVAVNSGSGRKSDICVLENGALFPVLVQSDPVIAMTAEDGDGGRVTVLSRGSLTVYEPSAAGGFIQKTSIDGSEFTSVYAYDGKIYALDALNALHRISADLSDDVTLIASASDIEGFFNMPEGIAAKNSRLFVADTVNGRIAVYGDKITYADRTFINPVSVASDSAGNMYVAYEYNKVGVFPAGSFAAEDEKTITSPNIGIIRQIAVNAEKTLFILADTGVWQVPYGGGAPQNIVYDDYRSIALGVGHDVLYALKDGAAVRFDFDGEGAAVTEYCAAPSGAMSLAVDLSGAAYFLTADGITRTAPGKASAFYRFTEGNETYTLGGRSGALLLCTVKNEFAEHGDVLVCDTYKHRVFKIDGKAELGVKLVDETYTDPPHITDQTPIDSGDAGIIRVALRDADVFSQPMETQPVYTVKKDAKIIVPHYDITDAREYAFVLIDDSENGKLVKGYMFKDVLDEPLPYSDPPSDMGTVFGAATPVYKWPSHNAPTVEGYGAVDRNTQFPMRPFVPSFRDGYGYVWYRIELTGGSDGYVRGVDISLMSYEPVFIHPAYNAEIVSYKKSTHATVYKYADGEYTAIDELATGTRVEVVGSFDSSKKYTLIKYLDPDYGTMTCYVRTEYIKYNGFNVVLIVAVLVIIVTVTLALIIIVRTARNKNK